MKINNYSTIVPRIRNAQHEIRFYGLILLKFVTKKIIEHLAKYNLESMTTTLARTFFQLLWIWLGGKNLWSRS